MAPASARARRLELVLDDVGGWKHAPAARAGNKESEARDGERWRMLMSMGCVPIAWVSFRRRRARPGQRPVRRRTSSCHPEIGSRAGFIRRSRYDFHLGPGLGSQGDYGSPLSGSTCGRVGSALLLAPAPGSVAVLVQSSSGTMMRPNSRAASPSATSSQPPSPPEIQ